MTRPWVSTRAPPLLPGLMAALVWTVSGRTTPLPSPTVPAAKLAMPSVTELRQSQRVTHGQVDVADLQLAGVGKDGGMRPRDPVHPDDGEIIRRERPHQAGDGHLSIEEPHPEAAGGTDHVIVGHDVTVAVVDNS